MAKSGRAAPGSGTIRKKTVEKNGKSYTFWEARLTVGHDLGTGKQIQRSFSGKTQAEVRKKLQAAAVEIDTGTYQEPTKLTVGQWLDIWADEYLMGVKPRTRDCYGAVIRVHLRPAFGSVNLQSLQTHQIQKFYNSLQKQGFSPKTIKNIHGVLHKSMHQAIELGYLRFNPADACKLPRVEKAEIKPLDSNEIGRFLQVIAGHPFQNVYLVALFTGMRQSELVGLSWDCVDFDAGTITVKQQLQRNRDTGAYTLATPKNGKSRRIMPAPTVMQALKQERAKQAAAQLRAGELWSNPLGLVFTNELGRNLSAQTVYLHFKKLAKQAGFPDTRFHDLRHSYAVAALQSGDNVKVVQETLGHFSAAFTLDVYAHVTEQMQRESSARMEQFIKDVSGA